MDSTFSLTVGDAMSDVPVMRVRISVVQKCLTDYSTKARLSTLMPELGLVPGGGGGYFGLRSYGDVPPFRVDFLTKNILDRVQIWVSSKCWAKKYFRPGRKLGFDHELF